MIPSEPSPASKSLPHFPFPEQCPPSHTPTPVGAPPSWPTEPLPSLSSHTLLEPLFLTSFLYPESLSPPKPPPYP